MATALGEISQKEPLPLDLLKRIDDLALDWKKGLFDAVLEASNLRGLRIWGYPYEDLRPLHRLKNLRRLGLIQGKLQSTSGIEAFPNLWGLELALLPRLTAEGVVLTPNLHTLEIGSCRKLTNLDFLAGAPGLRSLEIESKISVPTLQLLRACKHLEHLRLADVKVEDGCARFLLEALDLDCLWLHPISKHYDITKKDLRSGTPDPKRGCWPLLLESPYSN